MRVILVGGGEVVYFLSRTYLSKGYRVSVINLRKDKCEELAKTIDRVLVINGDGTDPKVLEDAGARESQLLLAVTQKDHINLVCCQAASLIFNIPSTLAIINDPDNYEVYKKLGITQVFNQTELIITMLKRKLSYDNVIPLMSWGEGKALINEVNINEKMPSIGIKLSDLKLPLGARIIGIEREDKYLSAKKDIEIVNNDRVVLMTTPENYGPTLRVIAGEEV